MPNPYFRFKQFTVFHDRCAMKVGTDGVLLGAWTNITNTQEILDIGTGTGLIALMLAQRSPAQIDAVEIDLDACNQAKENINNSPWSNRIQLYHNSIQHYAINCAKRYNLLISNPPFFTNASKAAIEARNLARHTDSLDQFDLLQIAEKLLCEDGRLAIIYPTEQAETFQEKAETFGFYCQRKLYVKSTLQSPIKRILLEFGKTKLEYQESTLVIETTRHTYSADFVALIKEFYLKY
ncbi:methyltransferase [Phormidium sp. LEGE 05292]|uniref:tRNA1(Val) (adenine(37)-N6)-methyltransferase n=1 Tax=[Phormidium] sp. LEGE 05292 TaxID=767427 RepID=UPI00187FB9FC|nr:methyltransferase [Phormidium sp. LEGE 05292]MBE9226861.1 methyltransferase [Phormidium sp. LEGE 05292]